VLLAYYIITPVVEVELSSETSVEFYRTSQTHISLHSHGRENLISTMIIEVRLKNFK
jgi:hypothetical protein